LSNPDITYLYLIRHKKNRHDKDMAVKFAGEQLSAGDQAPLH